jgi:hypothetical protein
VCLARAERGKCERSELHSSAVEQCSLVAKPERSGKDASYARSTAMLWRHSAQAEREEHERSEFHAQVVQNSPRRGPVEVKCSLPKRSGRMRAMLAPQLCCGTWLMRTK